MNPYRLLFDDFMQRLGWRFPVLVAWTALVGIGESFSIVLLLPLLSRIGITAARGQSAATNLINKGLALIGATGTIEILAVIVVVATTQTALSISLNWWTVRLARSYQARRQLALFSAFMRSKWSFMVDRKAGEMTNAIVTESERLGRAFTICLTLLSSAVIGAIYVVLAAMVAWQATISLVAFAALVGLTMAHLYRKSYKVGAQIAPLNSQLQSTLDEQFAGAKFIKASAGVDRATALVAPLIRMLEEANAYSNAMPGTVRGIVEYIALIGLAAILVLSSEGFGIAPANVVIVLALFGRLFPRLTVVQAQLHYLNGYVHAIDAVNRLQAAAETEAERQDRSSGRLQVDRPSALTVRNLQIKFGDQVAVDQASLSVPIPGMLAIVGSSGAGKSTLLHAILGLVESSAGSIQLAGHDIATAPLGAWRRTIGYVPQETILFHATIRDNLKLVNADASDSEVRTAARRANALDFIDMLPDGLDTVIGDQGVKLSGGQRQRLGIARALLTKPALLILDEAMSALDSESEAELLRTVEDLRKEMGVLLVAHRLAAARAADMICVFEAGRIVETGTWNELIARRTRLYALAEAQSRDSRAVAAI